MTTAHAARVRVAMAALTCASGIGFCLVVCNGPAPVYAAQPEQPFPKMADPLFPKDKNDVATGYAACSACHAQTLPVNDKTNIFAKNFKSHEFVLLSEGGTWLTQDPHSAAFKVLSQPLGQQMSKILKYDVTKAAQCLTCHAIDKYPGMAMPADVNVAERFDTAGGVTCNACHGVRRDWQGAHYADQNKRIPWRTHTPEEKEQKGMRNLRDPVVKAQLCASCHVGDPDLHRVVTHDMYAAGHPPLPPFELGTFMECEPMHWGSAASGELNFFTEKGLAAYLGGADPAAEFTKENPNWMWDLYRVHPAAKEVWVARQLAAGAVASLNAEMKLIAADAAKVAAGEEGAVDFARFDCYACHHDLKIPSARQARGYAGAPGRPPLKAWTAALPGVVAEHATGIQPFAGATKEFGPKWDAVQTAALARPFGKPKDLAAAATAMSGWCGDFMKRQQSETKPVYSKDEATKLLAKIGDAAVSKQWIGDPEAAMHLTWAYVTLSGHVVGELSDDKRTALGKVVPVRVREKPFSDTNGDPRTVGATLRQRLDLFNKFNPQDFSSTFGSTFGMPK